MTNNDTSAHPRFQFSLSELFALVLLTCCVTGLANYGTSSETDAGLKTIVLLSTALGTLFVTLSIAWLVKTGRGVWLAWIVAVPTVTAFSAVIILTPFLHCGCRAGPETAAAASCKAYAEAQEIFRRSDWDGDGVLEYAQDMQELIDHKAPGDGVVALIDRSFANADARLASPAPKAGYLYRRLLFRMEKGRPRSYIVNGNMLEGYAFVAFPYEYDVTGRNTFIISSIGTIYQKDLGPNTASIAGTMTVFDVSPGTGWVPAD